MKTTSVTPADLAGSVISVPPLARKADLTLCRENNARIIRHLEDGQVITLMYGGNANLYNLSVSELGPLCDLLEELAGKDSWVVPSVGADYGKAWDQLALLRERDFPTAMVLPLAFPATPSGVATGLRRLADHYGKPLIAYVKFEGYATPDDLAKLMEDGVICAVKYAIVRDNPAEDAFLSELVQKAGTDRIISGIGERPVIDHFTKFGLKAFTSGSVCVAPNLSNAIRVALQAGRTDEAVALRERFIALEDLRDGHSPLRILHEALRLAGIADTGPMLPFLDGFSDQGLLDALESATKALLAEDRQSAAVAAQ